MVEDPGTEVIHGTLHYWVREDINNGIVFCFQWSASCTPPSSSNSTLHKSNSPACHNIPSATKMSVTLEESLATPRTARPTPPGPNSVFEQFKLTGKTVIVTGAAEGIGFAVAEAMAEAGANVALW
jgi:NADPH:quinone reductase-like Zn-dependent oxidoreductase